MVEISRYNLVRSWPEGYRVLSHTAKIDPFLPLPVILSPTWKRVATWSEGGSQDRPFWCGSTETWTHDLPTHPTGENQGWLAAELSTEVPCVSLPPGTGDGLGPSQVLSLRCSLTYLRSYSWEEGEAELESRSQDKGVTVSRTEREGTLPAEDA